jgi:cell division transport system permease protein
MAKRGPGLITDPAGRFLPWIIAFLVYIAGLSLTGALALQEAAQSWRAGLSGTLTVEVSPIIDEDEAGMQARLERALALIRTTPGVEAAEAIPSESVRELLLPWLGPSLDVAALPLPRLIDIDLAQASGFDAAGLDSRLNAAVPGARVDDHAVWRDRLVRALRAMQVTGFASVTVLLLATVAMVVFATRGGLAAQRDVVELLHLIGATDGFIARQFQRHALRHALIGGTGGALAGAATILILGFVAGDLDVAPGGARLIDWPVWVALALTPLAAGGLALWAARRTVLATLARMT